MYDNSIQLMQSMREAGIDYRSDTPLDDENLIDTIRVGWAGANLPATVDSVSRQRPRRAFGGRGSWARGAGTSIAGS